MTLGPAARPCGSCPYRRDVPSGIWHESEYAKLPLFDQPTHLQPPGTFLCHQQDGHLCAGWVGCHDMDHNLGLKIATSMGFMSLEELERTRAYVSPVPLFASGREAADHGMRDLEEPGPRANRLRQRLLTKLKHKGVTT